jgi:hypothetical protein
VDLTSLIGGSERESFSGPSYPSRTPYFRIPVIEWGRAPGYEERRVSHASRANGDGDARRIGRDESKTGYNGVVFGLGRAGVQV